MEFLKIYRKVRKVFKRPRLQWYFGTWRKYNGLPMWREGPYISLYKNWNDTCYDKLTGKRVWSEQGKKNHPWLSKLFPAVITFPVWMRFMVHSNDVIYKTKWDEIRYEFEPQISIVFFGLCLAVNAISPDTNENDTYDYWETILNYLYESGEDLEKTANHAWFVVAPGGYYIKSTFNPKWLKNHADAELVGKINAKIIEEKTKIHQ